MYKVCIILVRETEEIIIIFPRKKNHSQDVSENLDRLLSPYWQTPRLNI